MFQLSWEIYGLYLFEVNRKKKSLITFSLLWNKTYRHRNFSCFNERKDSQTFKKDADISLKLIYE